MGKRLARVHVFALVAAAGLAASVLAVIGPAEASITNTAARGIQNCNPNSATITSACLSGALSDFNAARAKEHLGKLILPSNFRSLTVAEQMLVLTNLDRRARGISAITGLSTNLDTLTARAAKTRTDPAFPSSTRSGGSNWSSTYNALCTEFLWMYQDGVGGANMACRTSSSSGCWQHRRNILMSYAAPRVMGAGGYGGYGDATLYLGSDTHDTTFAFRWSSEAKYFPGGRVP